MKPKELFQKTSKVGKSSLDFVTGVGMEVHRRVSKIDRSAIISGISGKATDLISDVDIPAILAAGDNPLVLNSLVYKSPIHRLFWANTQKEQLHTLMKFLCKEKCHLLELKAKAKIVTRLQRAFSASSYQWIRDIIVSIKPEEMAEYKLIHDHVASTYFNLFHLVYIQLAKKPVEQSEILARLRNVKIVVPLEPTNQTITSTTANTTVQLRLSNTDCTSSKIPTTINPTTSINSTITTNTISTTSTTNTTITSTTTAIPLRFSNSNYIPGTTNINSESTSADLQLTNIIQRDVTKARRIKILSDVDDTFLCGGGNPIAGCDNTYPKGTIYPGVVRFYYELDVGPENESPDYIDDYYGNIVFLSARPHITDFGESEYLSYKHFSQIYKEGVLYCMPVLLSGNLSSMKIVVGDFEGVAKKKAKNFSEYRQIYPEYKFVFIGDNGQGDVVAGHAMQEKFSDTLLGVFIHQVKSIPETYGYIHRGKKWENISFFSTYVCAAVEAHKKGLIHLSAIYRVAGAAKEDFAQIKWDSTKKKQPALDALNKDITMANIYLQKLSLSHPTIEPLTNENIAAIIECSLSKKKKTHVLEADDEEGPQIVRTEEEPDV